MLSFASHPRRMYKTRMKDIFKDEDSEGRQAKRGLAKVLRTPAEKAAEKAAKVAEEIEAEIEEMEAAIEIEAVSAEAEAVAAAAVEEPKVP